MMNPMTATTILAAAVFAMPTSSSDYAQAFKFKLTAPYVHRCSCNPAFSPPFRPIKTFSPLSMITCHQQLKRRRRLSTALLAASKGTATLNTTDNDPQSIAPNPPINNPTTIRLNRNEKLFQKRLSELNDFRSQHGHGSIPTPYPPNPSLGIWAANLRRQYALWQMAEKKEAPYRGYLTSERRHQLIASGFDFSSLTERQFRTRIRELEAFKERYGHCMVPEKWEENLALGAWVSNIRSLYKRKRELQQKQKQAQQDERDTNKQDQQQRNGKKKARRPINWLLQSPHPPKKRQRKPRFSHLNDEQIKLLEDMGFVWSSDQKKWLEMLEWTKVYGVVNYLTKLSERDKYDAIQNGTLMEGGNNDDHASHMGLNSTDQNNKLIQTFAFSNYQTFVEDIQNPALIPSFLPQDKILSLLTGEAHIQNDLGQRQPSVQEQSTSILGSNNATQHPFQPCLDYRTQPNDTLHQPLRIWMINQRSNYNRLHHSNDNVQQETDPSALSSSSSAIPSTMTPQRQQALEDINFPWSGRFPHRVAEVQYEIDQIAKKERQREKERRIEQKEREERERVEQLTSSLVASVSTSSSEKVGEVVVQEVVEEVDIMALWDAEDDEDDDW